MQKDDFNSVGITPPRGRQGHSVPTPKQLGMEIPLSSAVNKVPSSLSNQPFAPKLDSWPTTDLQQSGSSSSNSSSSTAISPAQFYAHRDHVFGGSLSKLDRLRSYPDSFIMEAFDETEENENPQSESFSKDSVNGPSPTQASDLPPPGVSRLSSSGGRGGAGTNMSLDKLTGDSLLFFSYSATAGGSGSGMTPDPQLGGSFVRAFTQGLSNSLSVPYFPCASPVGGAPWSSGDQSHLFPTAARNPNKAIITIDAQSSRILMANEMTCELFGYQRNELSGMKIQNLFTEPYRGKQRALMEQNISASGETILVSGKVMDAMTSYGIEFPVSVWMRRVGKEKTAPPKSADSAALSPPPPSPQVQAPPTPRVIVVIEPVERSSAVFSMDSSHKIASCDPWFACLFGFQDSTEVIGRPVAEVIPSLELPETTRDFSTIATKQAVTGRAKDGTVFPLTVKFTDVSQTSLSISDLYSPVHSSQTHGTASTSDSSKYPTNFNSSVLSPSTSDPAPVSANPSPSFVTPPSEEESPPSTSPPSIATPHSAADSSPLDSHLQQQSSVSDPSPTSGYINAKVVVYAALSGMISFFLDGTIHGCNHHFALMLFGYTQQELQKKDITFLLPDFYQHIGYVDDRSMPLPPLDEEDDDLFHSVAERSFSPERASEFLKGLPLQEGMPSSRMKQQHLMSSPKKHGSPLRTKLDSLPVTAEVEEEEDVGIKGVDASCPKGDGADGEDTISTNETNRALGQSSSDQFNSSSSRMLHDPSQKSDSVPSSSQCNASSSKQQALPPVPHRLVPSRSTERIMELLSQHDTKKEAEECKQIPLSSTPAVKTQENNNRAKSQNSSQDMDRMSLVSQMSFQDGTFLGDARHKDGSLMAVVFQLKRITLGDGQEIYCMWLSRDLDMERARTADLSMSMNRPPDPYRHRVMISPEVDVKGGVESTDQGDVPGRRSSGAGVGACGGWREQQQQAEEVLAMEGEYSLSYNTLRPIGKGAFGFVRLAQKIKDDSMVVVKFLRKSSVLKDCWIEDQEMGRVPLEIALLARLSHCNIVQLLEAYENEHFFQMVMEKHGEGLDLFEFIERGPRLTEQHISFIFRQVISALKYLHGKSIVHRDIKDENIIIDQRFNIKLIDFGSAAYMAPGKLFHTFCGTLEYCSPEVLLGNSYGGPELEMWAVGVTLYTLVFGENPFFDVEETISGHLQPPFLTSPALMKVLLWLLHPDPKSRATITDLQKDKWTNQPLDDSLLNFDTVFGQVTEDVGGGRGSHGGVVKKSNSEGGAAQLSKSLLEQLVVSEKGAEKGGGAWC